MKNSVRFVGFIYRRLRPKALFGDYVSRGGRVIGFGAIFVAVPFPPLLVCRLGGTQQVVEFSSWTAFLRLFLLPGADVRSFEGDASDIVRRFAKNFEPPPAYPAAGGYLDTGDFMDSLTEGKIYKTSFAEEEIVGDGMGP